MTGARGWTCRRATGGARCGHANPPRTRKCQLCGKPRPARRRAKHVAALDADYAQFVELNGGNRCGICGRPPSLRRRLDRDHSHKTGKPRGLLCHACNRTLTTRVTVTWLEQALDYLKRTEAT